MSEAPPEQADTRQRVLESAVNVFAQQGFRDATIHEICQRADANIAAVNYYFGSKEALYAEAWRKAFIDNVAAHPPDGGVPSGAPPEERLRGRVRALVHSFADEDNQAFLIAHREMASPTRLLIEVKRECLAPLHEMTARLVRELLGPAPTEQQARFCEISVMSQCVDIMRRRHMHRLASPPEGAPPVIDDVDAYVEHVFRFALAGIRAVRARAEEGGAHE